MVDSTRAFTTEAYSPTGELWWKTQFRPGTKQKLGDEVKLAAWLASTKSVGDKFSMPDLRQALGDSAPNSAEHLNRRLRELRSRDGWVIYANKDDGKLRMGEYRLQRIGWHPGTGKPRSAKKDVSQAVRRRVFERDGHRCVVCGVGAGEPYPGEPEQRATLTAGHLLANDHGGSGRDLNNLRTECKRCNEPVRQEIRRPESLIEVLPDVRNLKRSDKQRLLDWTTARQRTRDDLDTVYDRVRLLSDDEKHELQLKLKEMVGVR